MWPWEPCLEDYWQCSVAFFSLVMELSDYAQSNTQSFNSRGYPSNLHQNRQEVDLYKWCLFLRERFLTYTVFSRSPLEARIEIWQIKFQQIIVTKVWQHITIDTSVEGLRDFSHFLEMDYMLSQYLENILLIPQGKQLIEDTLNDVALGIYIPIIKWLWQLVVPRTPFVYCALSFL